MLCHRDIRFCIKERRGERERAKEEMIPFKKPQTGSNCEYLFYCLLPRRERRGENGRSNTVGKKECESLLGGERGGEEREPVLYVQSSRRPPFFPPPPPPSGPHYASLYSIYVDLRHLCQNLAKVPTTTRSACQVYF